MDCLNNSLIVVTQDIIAIDWMFVSPQNSYIESNPQYDGVRRWGFGEMIKRIFKRVVPS